MKKLLLIPTVLATAVLAMMFLMPATAAGALHAVAPALHAPVPSVVSAAPANKQGAASVNQAQSQGSNAQSSSNANPNRTTSTTDRGHAVATAGRMNCGRFGNGFHGGKHDFVCPNRPFPAAAS